MTTLAALHAQVPAAEALDLVEELELDRAGRWPVDEEDPQPDPEPEDDSPPPTHAQAVAIVQHYLGGRVIS